MINCKREELDTYLRNIRETWSTDHRRKSGRSKHVRTEKKVTTVNELIGLLSQQGQKQTPRSARQFVIENSVTILRKSYFYNWYKFLVCALSSLLNGMLFQCNVIAIKIIIYSNIVCFCLQHPKCIQKWT